MSSVARFDTWRSSSVRLAAAYSVLFACALAAGLGVTYERTARLLESELDAVALVAQDALVDAYATGGRAALVERLEGERPERARAGVYAAYVAHAGAPVVGDLAGWPRLREPGGPAGSGAPRRWEYEGLRLRARLHEFEDGGRLLVGVHASGAEALLARLAAALASTLLLGATTGVVLALAYAQQVRRRVRRAAAACDAILAGATGARLPVSGNRDEFDALAASVNGVLGRLQQQSATVRATFDSAAHDLRAPLFRARAALEDWSRNPGGDAAGCGRIAAATAELDRIQRTLGTLLQIAKVEARVGGLPSEPLRLDRLAGELVDLYQPLAADRGLVLALAAQPVAVRGHAQLLSQALANLLDNALRYLPAGCRVDVEVGARDGWAWLGVTDDGPGFAAPPTARPETTRMRADADAANTIEGAGLGLRLVASIAALHGGTFDRVPTARGVRLALRLPVAPENGAGR